MPALLQCSAVQCSEVQCISMLFSTLKYSAVQCSAVQIGAAQCNAVHRPVLSHTVLLFLMMLGGIIFITSLCNSVNYMLHSQIFVPCIFRSVSPELEDNYTLKLVPTIFHKD